MTLNYSTLFGNHAGSGGGIYNNGTVTVQNSSNITGNKVDNVDGDVVNGGVLYLDGTSTIGIIEGNSAISF